MPDTLTDKDIVNPLDSAADQDIPAAENFVEIEDMVDWDSPPSLDELKSDLTRAQSDHDAHVSNVDTWLDNLNVEGKAKPKKRKGKSSIQPAVIRKQAEWRYANLSEPFLAPDDLYTAAPVTFEDKESAIQNELLLNKQIRSDIDLVSFIDDYVRAAVNEGTIILRTGWEYEEEEQEVTKPVYGYKVDNSPKAAAMMEVLATRFQQQGPEYLDTLPPQMAEALGRTIQQRQIIVPFVEQNITQTEIVILKNHPTVEVCDYDDVIIDPTAKGDIDKAQFVISRFPTSKAQLRADGIYENIDFVVADESSILNAPDSEAGDKNVNSFNFADDARKQFYAYEYWGFRDINGTGETEAFVTTWAGNTVLRMEENPFPDKEVPFLTVPYLPVKNSVYGEPDGVLIEDNQKVVGAIMRGMIDVMARGANGQQGSRKDALDATNRRRFERGDDYEFNPNVDPEQAFHMHKYDELPQSAPFMLNLMNAEAESMTGVKSFGSGLSGDALGVSSARGVQGVLDSAAKRELGILRRMASGLVKVGRKFMSMNSEFLSEEEVVRVTNDTFVPIRRDDLKGKIDLKLKITTAEEDNQKAQELAFMLQTNGPNSDPGEVRMIRAEIARLRKMPELAKRIEEFEPKPDPLQQEIQLLQIEKLKKEIAELDSKAFENFAGGEADLAKAANLRSDTDKKDLDFVEQESGTKHAREVNKITSQSRAQTEKSIVESQLAT